MKTEQTETLNFTDLTVKVLQKFNDRLGFHFGKPLPELTDDSVTEAFYDVTKDVVLKYQPGELLQMFAKYPALLTAKPTYNLEDCPANQYSAWETMLWTLIEELRNCLAYLLRNNTQVYQHLADAALFNVDWEPYALQETDELARQLHFL